MAATSHSCIPCTLSNDVIRQVLHDVFISVYIKNCVSAQAETYRMVADLKAVIFQLSVCHFFARKQSDYTNCCFHMLNTCTSFKHLRVFCFYHVLNEVDIVSYANKVVVLTFIFRFIRLL